MGKTGYFSIKDIELPHFLPKKIIFKYKSTGNKQILPNFSINIQILNKSYKIFFIHKFQTKSNQICFNIKAHVNAIV